jgi:UDP-N-acetylmuramoyl-tripeptide--D-alanyl-D-alanine ligase
MDTEDLYQLYLECDGVCTDTRDIRPGSLFFALKGEHFDANSFVIEALERGALFAIASDPSLADHPRFKNQIVIVSDTLKALQDLAHHHRMQFTIPVIGITGTNGKTTTKNLVSEVLKCSHRIVRTEGNLNNHIGVPLTLLRIKKSTQIAIIEMGANHPNDIRELCAIAEPTHGVITNIGLAHLEGFGSKEGVAQAKGALYEWLRDHKGTIFVNAHDRYLVSLMVSIDPHCHAETVRYGDEAAPENKHLFGDFNKENMRVAMALGTFFKVPKPDMVKALQNYEPKDMRSQKIVTEKENEIILDAYNANPSSMKAALASFADMASPSSKTKWVILGDMRELGETTATEHQHVIQDLSFYGFSNVILVGEFFCEAHGDMKKYACFKTKDDFLASPFATSIRNALVLIKGSNGMKMWEIAEKL